MKKSNSFLLVVIILLTLNVKAQLEEPIPMDPAVRIGKLSNGLTYYIRHNNKPEQRADFYIVQKVGSILEEEHQRGLAHFLEHMCFNGTKNFPGNSLISELEQKGIKFGANINAYTGIDETVYLLTNIPVGREGIIDTALLILHDWSGFVTLKGKDIDDERGVIREEWRASASGGRRLFEQTLPIIYKGSPYTNRLPIGSIDVINNFPHQAIRDYYKKWYRPDLQGIIIVGDIDVDVIEKKIRQLFEDIPAPHSPAKRVYFNVPDNVTPIVAIASDPEVTSTSVTVFWKLKDVPKERKLSKSYYRYILINGLISSMFNNRLSELYLKQNPPFDYADGRVSNFLVSNIKKAWTVSGIPVNSNVENALQAMLTESRRMQDFGFTQPELERIIKNKLVVLESTYADKGNTNNGSFVNEYTQHFLYNEPSPGIEWEYKTTKELLTELPLDSVNYWAKQYISDTNMVIYVTGPEKEGITLPSEKQLLTIWDKVKESKLDPYVYKEVTGPLIAVQPIPGKVIKTVQKPFGYVEWTLSNGVKVQVKNTGYDEDKVVLYAHSPGGKSLLPLEDLTSTVALGLFNRMGTGEFTESEKNKILSGKMASATIFVKDYFEFISGSSSINDIETMLQLTYLRFTSPGKDTNIFNNVRSAMIDEIKIKSLNPDQIFQDSLFTMINYYNARNRKLDTVILNQVDFQKTLKTYKQRFCNAADFTFFITGNMELDSIKPLVENYLGGLPTSKSREKIIDHGIYPPEGIIKKHFSHKMKTPKTTVAVFYSGKLAYTLENIVLINYLENILGTIYLETIREKEGGAYGVSVRGGMLKIPQERYFFQISFNTDPLKQDTLIKIVYSELEKMMTQGPNKENVDKVKMNLLKRHSENLSNQNADYWSRTATTLFVYGVDERSNYEKVVTTVTPEMVHQFAKEIFSSGNIIELVMNPEE
ncbi:MAG: insulinase family protein [Salinivirgaceae bacterium]|nr:insulinase family protein [Salinivirgaceae bacterium]